MISVSLASIGFIFGTLVDIGRADLAYDLLLSEGTPSYKYMIEHDATAIWETWYNITPDGTRNTASYTQYCLGSVGNWLMSDMGGIAPMDPGYKKIKIAPVADPKGRVNSADTSFDTPHGLAKVSRKTTGKTMVFPLSL